MEKSVRIIPAVRFAIRFLLFAVGFSYALNQYNNSKPAVQADSSCDGPEVTVFWQGHSPNSDPGVRLFKDFSGFLPPDFSRFPFFANAYGIRIFQIPAEPQQIFLRFLRTSISINAP
jgi:hypothetical protein